MHGYLWNGLGSMPGRAGVFGYGGMWFLVGFALLLIVGLIVWLVVSKRTTQPQGGGTAQVLGAPRRPARMPSPSPARAWREARSTPMSMRVSSRRCAASTP